MIKRYLVLSAVAGLLLPAPARAQGDPLSALLPKLLGSVTLAPPTDPRFPSHEAHFLLISSNGSLAPGAASTAPFVFNSMIVAQLSTFPLGSSAGGFTWQFDPVVGTFTRTSDSFGPAFAERAITNGRNKWTVGMNYVHARYDRFGGQDLQNGGLTMFLYHKHDAALTAPADFFEGDVVRESVSMNLTTDSAVFTANYGVSQLKKWRRFMSERVIYRMHLKHTWMSLSCMPGIKM
jgi:hypothetical protein